MIEIFKNIIYLFIMTNVSLFALDNNFDNKADCLILKDENSIICKYSHKRVNFDKIVKFDWIEPNGDITRSKNMPLPAGHGSVYDYRYLKGRTKGNWTFKVTDDNSTTITHFIIE